MKFFLTFIFSSILLSQDVVAVQNAPPKKQKQQQQQRDLQSLQDLWYFRRNTTFNVQDTTLQFLYRSSDYIEDDMTHGVILDAETCNVLIADAEDYGLVLNKPVSSDAPGDGFGYRDWVMDLDINLPPSGTVQSTTGDDSPSIYRQTLDPVTNDTIGIWNFCILIALNTPPDDDDPYGDLIVNWQEFLVEFEEDADLQSLNVSLFDRTSLHTEYAGTANLFFCDPTDQEVTHPLIMEGDEVLFCVTPPDGYQMKTVDFFKYEANDGGTNQAAIRDDQSAQNGLTSFECSQYTCTIRTVLSASFFISNTVVLAYGNAIFTDSEGNEFNSGISMYFETLFDLLTQESFDQEGNAVDTPAPTALPNVSPPTMTPVADPTPPPTSNMPPPPPTPTEGPYVAPLDPNVPPTEPYLPVGELDGIGENLLPINEQNPAASPKTSASAATPTASKITGPISIWVMISSLVFVAVACSSIF